MRKIEYLSPTSIATFLKSEEEFYFNYLCDNRPPRDPQTQLMSIGSSFDAYVKSYLHENLFGKGHDPKFEFNTLFEAQVEPHNRDWAKPNGSHAFKCYKASGALADLMLELQSAVGTPRFELEIKGVVEGHKEGTSKKLGGVTFLGKPDVFYINKEGHYVILDWKVNGWLAKRTTSPVPGYIRIRNTSGKSEGPHKNCKPSNFKGMLINADIYLEQVQEDWARQLAIYSWLCGSEIGEECITAIDQLTCTPSGFEYPFVKIAEHRTRITSEFQWNVFTTAQSIWDKVQSGHYFRELSKEDSEKKCLYLDGQAKSLRGETNDNESWFAQEMRDLNRRPW